MLRTQAMDLKVAAQRAAVAGSFRERYAPRDQADQGGPGPSSLSRSSFRDGSDAGGGSGGGAGASGGTQQGSS